MSTDTISLVKREGVREKKKTRLEMSKKYTRQDVAGHRSREDIYIVLKSKVYNVTRFISMHPWVMPLHFFRESSVCFNELN